MEEVVLPVLARDEAEAAIRDDLLDGACGHGAGPFPSRTEEETHGPFEMIGYDHARCCRGRQPPNHTRTRLIPQGGPGLQSGVLGLQLSDECRSPGTHASPTGRWPPGGPSRRRQGPGRSGPARIRRRTDDGSSSRRHGKGDPARTQAGWRRRAAACVDRGRESGRRPANGHARPCSPDGSGTYRSTTSGRRSGQRRPRMNRACAPGSEIASRSMAAHSRRCVIQHRFARRRAQEGSTTRPRG